MRPAAGPATTQRPAWPWPRKEEMHIAPTVKRRNIMIQISGSIQRRDQHKAVSEAIAADGEVMVAVAVMVMEVAAVDKAKMRPIQITITTRRTMRRLLISWLQHLQSQRTAGSLTLVPTIICAINHEMNSRTTSSER